MIRHGVVTAFVHAVDAAQGRVQVEYPGMEDRLRSTWAPVAAPMSGGQRGQLFMPEVGDECLVAFHDGQFNHPFVVGFLWNGEHVSSERDAFNRVIVTPGGHQLRFEDKANDTRIILRSNGQHELTLEDLASGPFIRLKTKAGRELLLDDGPAGGKVQITSALHTITLDDGAATSEIKVEAGSGAVTLTLKMTPPSVMLSVGGNTVDIGPSGMSITAAGNVNVTSGGAATVTVGGTANIVAGGAATITAATMTLSAGALTVAAGVSTFAGPIITPTLVAGTVVASTYTPGIGNLL
jgi:hypothetical protein